MLEAILAYHGAVDFVRPEAFDGIDVNPWECMLTSNIVVL
jgi:hypothetical protein